MSSWMKFNSMNSINPIMEQLTMFHDHTLMLLISVTVTVIMMMVSTTKNKFINNTMLENQMLETIWTIIPTIILIFIALPSIKILYLMDEIMNPWITIKIIGHQWYWSYEYSDTNKKEFESYMSNEKNMKSNFRLIETDNRMTIPFSTQMRLIITSTDVIHSWAIPAAAVKMDAIPGRLNQTNFIIKTPGLFFGQCSEICGANHSFMPITIESVNLKTFLKWIKS